MYARILKNSSYLLGAQMLTKVISFFYTFFLARNLSIENFGLLTVALSYFSLVSALAELGINRYITRSIALHAGCDGGRKKTAALLCTVTMFRLTVVTITFALFAVFLRISDPDNFRVTLSLLAVSAILPQAIAFTLDSVFIGVEKMFMSSVGLLGLNIATTAMGMFLVSSGYDVLGATAAIVLGQVFYVLILLLIPLRSGLAFLREHSFKEHVFSLESFREIAQGSLPYGILGVLGLVYFKIDSLLLAYIKGSFDAGIYGAAYKFLEAIVFVPATVATAMFPVLARMHETNKNEVKRLYWKTVGTLFSTSLFVFLGFVVVLPILIRLYLPQYNDSILALIVLSFTIPFMFVHVPGALVLLSTDKYLTPVILLSILTVGFNIIMNLILIPPYGYMGAAVVTVLSEILSFVVFFSFLQLQVFKR